MAVSIFGHEFTRLRRALRRSFARDVFVTGDSVVGASDYGHFVIKGKQEGEDVPFCFILRQFSMEPDLHKPVLFTPNAVRYYVSGAQVEVPLETEEGGIVLPESQMKFVRLPDDFVDAYKTLCPFVDKDSTRTALGFVGVGDNAVVASDGAFYARKTFQFPPEALVDYKSIYVSACIDEYRQNTQRDPDKTFWTEGRIHFLIPPGIRFDEGSVDFGAASFDNRPVLIFKQGNATMYAEAGQCGAFPHLDIVEEPHGPVQFVLTQEESERVISILKSAPRGRFSDSVLLLSHGGYVAFGFQPNYGDENRVIIKTNIPTKLPDDFMAWYKIRYFKRVLQFPGVKYFYTVSMQQSETIADVQVGDTRCLFMNVSNDVSLDLSSFEIRQANIRRPGVGDLLTSDSSEITTSNSAILSLF